MIIGNGVAGTTCARHIRKRSDADRITVVSGETDHFFSRTALMYIYMGHMKYEHTKPYEDWFWEKNRIELKRGWVKDIDTSGKKLTFDSGEAMSYDKLVLACGSKPNKFGWPGQDLDGVQGLYSYQDLELLEKNTHPPKSRNNRVKRAVLVGGGLIGVELAEMLFTRNIEVTFLVRESKFWGNVLPKEEGELVSRHMRKHHVDLRLEEELDEILPDEQGRVRAVKTKNGEEIECQFVGLTAGVSPNIGWLKETGIAQKRGILVNEFLETNIEDVYAIGDCTQFETPPAGVRPMNQVWYTGRIMGETLAQTLTGNRTAYRPGPWFNSAKFFDVEYQTYGDVLARMPEHVSQFYWEHPDGEKCIKIQFETATGKFLGINTFGIRLRHEVFDQWLKDGKDVQHIVKHLRQANFDPEFYRSHEHEIAEKWNKEFPNMTVSVKKRFLVF